MSLQYIIDGYNLTHHQLFKLHAKQHHRDDRRALIEFILVNRLCKSTKNTITIVFDGFSDVASRSELQGMRLVFSGEISADEKIRGMLESVPARKNIIVVSDDKQIRLHAQSCHAQALTVEEFIQPLLVQKEKERMREAASEMKLSCAEQLEITRELKKIWLK